MRLSSALLYVGVASLGSGALLGGASFYPFSAHTVMLFRIVGGFMLAESIVTLWFASKSRDNRPSGRLPAISRKQDWSWIWWCALAIATLFGFHYWINGIYNRQVSSDWGNAYALYQHKNYAGAEVYFQTYSDETGDTYGKGHYYLGLCLEGDGRIDEARVAFQEALRRSGPKGNYWSNIAQARHRSAQQELDKMTLISPR